jgi:zinc protease
MPHRLILRSFCIALFLACLAAVPARAAVDLNAPIPAGPQVKVGKLANGLTYYIQRGKNPAQRLELRLVVKAGSVQEDDDQQGLAHVVEHMAFNGSTHFGKHELVDYLRRIGMNIGADLNAYTSYEETVYQLSLPTARMDDVDHAFTILEDWAHGLSFDPADIDKERNIVLEELRLRKGVGERLDKVLMPRVFNGAIYARRKPEGQENVIRSFQREALRRFYRDWYRPDLMAVVAVGDIDPVVAERQIRRHFGALANPGGARARPDPEIAPRTATEAVAITDDDLTVNSVNLHYPVHAAPDPGTYGGYRGKLVEKLFNMMLGQRLEELAQQPSPPFMDAESYVNHITPRHKGFFAGATLGAGGSAPAIAALVQEQLRVRQYGFSGAELERARKIVMGNYERAYNERDATYSAAFAAEYIRNFLNGETLPGTVAEYRLVKELLPGIGLDDVNAFARQWIPADGGKLVVYMGAGKGAPAPREAELLAELEAAGRAPVAAREEKALPAQLMARPSAPGGIVEESRDELLGIVRLTLSNGVKVILKPTAFNREQVLLSARRGGGQLLSDARDLMNARYASAAVAAMGLKDFAPLDLKKVLAGRNAGVALSLGDYTDDISGWSGGGMEDIETMFQLLTLRFTGLRRDEGLYRGLMDKEAEYLRRREADPDARFDDAINDTLYGKNPWQPRAVALEDLARVDLDGSMRAYRERFSSARGFTFILVGAFDVATIKPLLADYLGTLPTPDLPLDWRDRGLRYASGVHKKEVAGGATPRSTLALTFTGPVEWSPAESLRMQALIEVMNLRVFDVFREKLGLIYGGSMSGGVNRVPYQHYSIGTTLSTGPDKVDRLVAAIFAELARMKAEGPDPADLDKVKKNWRQSWQRSLRENGYWLSELQSVEFDHTDPHRILTIMDEADAITPDQIRQAAQRYFNTGNYVQVVMHPQSPQ